MSADGRGTPPAGEFVPGVMQLLDGPTLKDQFAMAALSGFLANPTYLSLVMATSESAQAVRAAIADDCYQQAEAMLVSRAAEPAS